MTNVFDRFRQVILEPYSFRDNKQVGIFLEGVIVDLRKTVDMTGSSDFVLTEVLLILERRAKDLLEG